MSRRVTAGVERPAPVSVFVNGKATEAHEGESIAAALLASGHLGMSRGRQGRLRGPFCNMGICCDCIVTVENPDAPGAAPLRLRSCLASVRAGLRITIAEDPADGIGS